MAAPLADGDEQGLRSLSATRRGIPLSSMLLRREPLGAVSLELPRSDDPDGPVAVTGLTTTIDQAGWWSLSLSQPPSQAYFMMVARAIGIPSRVVAVTATAGSR
jgi:hypothetical protein